MLSYHYAYQFPSLHLCNALPLYCNLFSNLYFLCCSQLLSMQCARTSTVPSSLISKLLNLIAAVSPTHHLRLLCCILIPTAAAKTPTTLLLFFLSTMWTALPIHDSTHSEHPPFKLIFNTKFYKKKNAFSPIPVCLLPSSLLCWAGGNWRSH